MMDITLGGVIAIATFILAIIGVSAGAVWAISGRMDGFKTVFMDRLDNLQTALSSKISDQSAELHGRINDLAREVGTLEGKQQAMEARCRIHHKRSDTDRHARKGDYDHA